MHISDICKIFLVLTGHAYRILPFVYEFQYTIHRRGWKSRRSLWKPSYELVEEVFGCDLEMHRVAAVLDERVEELVVRIRGIGYALSERDDVSWPACTALQCLPMDYMTHAQCQHGFVSIATVDVLQHLYSSFTRPVSEVPSQRRSFKGEQKQLQHTYSPSLPV